MPSLDLLKNCVKLSVLITLILGIVGLVCAFSIGSDDIFISGVKDTKRAIMVVTIVFSIILILIAISGIVGIWKKHTCCLIIYNIGVLIFFIAFLIVAICSFAVFKHYYTTDITNPEICRNQTWIRPADNYAMNASKYLCSPSCPCNVDPASTWLNASKLTVNSTGAVKLQDCPNFRQAFTKFSELFIPLELIEKQFKCAGICEKNDFFIFSNINAFEPKEACASKMLDFFISYSKKIGAATVIIALLLFLTILASLCLCCHPERRREEGGFYQKLQP